MNAGNTVRRTDPNFGIVQACRARARETWLSDGPPPHVRRMMVRGLVTLVAASVMVVALGVVAGVPPGSNEAGDVITDQTTATAAQARPRLTLATFNILGHSHTEPGGQYAAMASGTVRR
jgi:hypothetical protein